MKHNNYYPLDTSAMIHLAARSRRHSNAFRITISLREPVQPQTLQEAVDKITPRFPSVIAGIHAGLFQYRLVPAQNPPAVRPDTVCLAPMRRTEVKTCAVRFLYQGNQISAEFFHSLTDGYGGMVVLGTLAAAYLQLRYGCSIPVSALTLDQDTEPKGAELIDDYLTHAGSHPQLPSHEATYQLPGQAAKTELPQTSARFYIADEVSAAARRYGVSVTTFLSAVMSAAVLQIQHTHGGNRQAVQIMIPVNLRKLFESSTLRNFALFALLRIQPTRTWTFENLTQLCKVELREQNTAAYMSALMAGNKMAATFPLFRILPLPLKVWLLRIVHHICGEQSSCISLSNLGIVKLPEEMQEYVSGIDFLLTPRIKSPYNCGVVTYDGILSIHFTRSCLEPELEDVFFSKLEQILKSNTRGSKNDGAI